MYSICVFPAGNPDSVGRGVSDWIYMSVVLYLLHTLNWGGGGGGGMKNKIK